MSLLSHCQDPPLAGSGDSQSQSGPAFGPQNYQDSGEDNYDSELSEHGATSHAPNLRAGSGVGLVHSPAAYLSPHSPGMASTPSPWRENPESPYRNPYQSGGGSNAALMAGLESPAVTIDWQDSYPLDGLEVKPELMAIVTRFANLRRTGGNINRDLRRQKSFKNPDLLPRMIASQGICEIGSNFDPAKFDPFKWEASSFFSNLSIAQARALEEEKAREKEREEQEEREARAEIQATRERREREGRDSGRHHNQRHNSRDHHRRDDRRDDRRGERGERDSRGEQGRRDSRGSDGGGSFSRDERRDSRDGGSLSRSSSGLQRSQSDFDRHEKDRRDDRRDSRGGGKRARDDDRNEDQDSYKRDKR